MSTRPTLKQLANGNAVQQWACPRCGGRVWWVIDSRFLSADGIRRRTRECRRCHHAIRTVEKMESTSSEDGQVDIDE